MADWLCGEGGDLFYKETSHQGHCAARSLVPTPQCLVPPRAGLLRALQMDQPPDFFSLLSQLPLFPLYSV